MQIPLEAPRFTAEHTVEGWCITIPAQKRWFIILFLFVWLNGWLLGEVTVATQLLTAHSKTPWPFLAIWLTLWTLGGIMAFIELLWQLTGKEKITVNETTLQHHTGILGGLGFTRSYERKEISKLHATGSTPQRLGGIISFFKAAKGHQGAVGFDYGARTYHFGTGLDPAEARELVAQLQTHLPKSVDTF